MVIHRIWHSKMTAEEERQFYEWRGHMLGKCRLEDWRDVTESLRQMVKTKKGDKRHGAMRRT